jgi:hypothetical protein
VEAAMTTSAATRLGSADIVGSWSSIGAPDD